MTNEELLQLIAQAEREGWEELDLRDKGLTELPPEIGNLNQVTRLNLGSHYRNAEVKPDLEHASQGVDHLDYPYSRSHSRAEGKGLRAFHDLLAEVGWKPGAANLRRVTDKKSGDVLWVCPTHYKEYDPGLPVLP